MPKYTMSDGREFTDYKPSCELNEWLQKRYNLNNSHAFRYFLQRNGEKIMKDLSECDPVKECAVCPVCKLALEKK